jgi:TonB family protein
MTEIWTKWESQVVNGVFPLRRFLGRSNHSVVFLTEARDFPNGAIKLIPSDPLRAEAQLAHWRTAATLSHPHLMRLLDAGQCQLGGHPFLFVVMEYGEQTLAQILAHRALTPDEVREMLAPTLGALAFLHGKNLVQGQLKPPNLLVVGDQLQLSSDGIRPAGEAAASVVEPYDPPEAGNGSLSTAGDVWGLGMIVVEALTQNLPAWLDERSETASLPGTFPPEFADIVQRCLNRDPAKRPTIAEIEAQINGAPKTRVVSVPEPAVSEAPGRPIPRRMWPSARLFIPALAAGLAILLVVWAGLRLFHGHPNSQPLTSSISEASSPPAALPPAASQHPQAAPSSVSSSPVHQEIPDVARGARDSIRGHIKVTVRVTVDRAGNVVSESLENSGSSKYFARLASEAARKWKFAPADDRDSRVWLLRFEFSRAGTTAHADALR